MKLTPKTATRIRELRESLVDTTKGHLSLMGLTRKNLTGTITKTLLIDGHVVCIVFIYVNNQSLGLKVRSNLGARKRYRVAKLAKIFMNSLIGTWTAYTLVDVKKNNKFVKFLGLKFDKEINGKYNRYIWHKQQ